MDVKKEYMMEEHYNPYLLLHKEFFVQYDKPYPPSPTQNKHKKRHIYDQGPLHKAP